jgi:TonB family protein
MLILNTSRPLIDFSSEVYGVILSYPNNGDSIQIKEVMYQEFAPNTRHVVSEQFVDYETFKKDYPELAKSIKLKITKDLIKIFKKYHVYSIRRLGKVFIPSDTLPHYIKRRNGKEILVTSRNENKSLVIEFDENYHVVQVADALKTHDIIVSVEYNQPIYPGPDYDAPILIEYLEPSLPDSFQSKNINGRAILSLTVNENGKVTAAKIIKSDLEIDSILIESVKSWRFEPGKRDGIPTELNISFPFTYKEGKLKSNWKTKPN